MLSMVWLSMPKISASFSCESPSPVFDPRTAEARFCLASFIVIHLDSSLYYTSSCVNCIRIQLESEMEYIVIVAGLFNEYVL